MNDLGRLTEGFNDTAPQWDCGMNYKRFYQRMAAGTIDSGVPKTEA